MCVDWWSVIMGDMVESALICFAIVEESGRGAGEGREEEEEVVK